MNPLKTEFDYYIKNQAELVAKYPGKFIVIKNSKIIGAYNDKEEAYAKAREKYELGSFLIQQVEPGESSYTQTFHSRVA